MISPAQIRAARALLNWSQSDLSNRAGISIATLKNIERGKSDPRASSLLAIQTTLENAGLIFLADKDNRDGGPGVRFRIFP